MKKEKKQLIKSFKIVIKDLLDNYENYTDEEKAQIKEIFKSVTHLNTVLDKYDVFKESYWTDFLNAYSQYFDMMHLNNF